MDSLALVKQLKAMIAEKLDIHATSINRSKKTIIKPVNKGSGNQAVIVLNPSAASSEEYAAAQQLIRDAFNSGEVLLVDDETKRIASDVAKTEENSGNGDLVEFFVGKLSVLDLQILRSGLYIDYLIKQGMPTGEIRQSILVRYGTRGKNILNLASSGHFKTHIQPLYEEMSKLDHFTNEMFYGEFEKILNEMPFAIFVNSSTSAEQLHQEILDKINQAKRNSVTERKLYIHGWGGNVRTIEQCVDNLNESSDIEFRMITNKRKEVIEIVDVTVEF